MSDLRSTVTDIIIRETVGEIANEDHVRAVYERVADAVLDAIAKDKEREDDLTLRVQFDDLRSFDVHVYYDSLRFNGWGFTLRERAGLSVSAGVGSAPHGHPNRSIALIHAMQTLVKHHAGREAE